jgi:hypothetical protein
MQNAGLRRVDAPCDGSCIQHDVQTSTRSYGDACPGNVVIESLMTLGSPAVTGGSLCDST